ncbi:hypothetical protein L9F63_021544 [Diploptera punctata]|uniref:CN hydrolase domain-containing protein n=1 Tax=Diploptera punctata TaxID=6984 RepID=A0AAD7ZQP3_DIPPU|nr:hypothetical protein L9F63_021544 [Diploptera punctata]
MYQEKLSFRWIQKIRLTLFSVYNPGELFLTVDVSLCFHGKIVSASKKTDKLFPRLSVTFSNLSVSYRPSNAYNLFHRLRTLFKDKTKLLLGVISCHTFFTRSNIIIDFTDNKKMLLATVVFVFSVFCTGQETQSYNKPYYTAAVVEYNALGNASQDDPKDILRMNANNYIKYIKQAANMHDLDIIVFPECGLSTIHLPQQREGIRPFLTEIPDPKKSTVNPCVDTQTEYLEVLHILSCAARDFAVYVVVNLPEIVPCEGQGCPTDGAFFYNTDVAFDRTGKLIARYRKYNLFGEPGFNVTRKAELSVFDTDFGVRFGLSTCFDIFFHDPIMKLVEELGVTDIAFPVAWFSELPFLTAVQVHSSWAYATNVNLLASGYSEPANYNGGTGLYAGKQGILKTTISFIENSEYVDPKTHMSNHLLISKVPKRIRNDQPAIDIQNTTKSTNPPEESERVFFPDYLDPYTTYLIRETEVNRTVCDRGLCCQFYIQLQTVGAIPDAVRYRIMVLNGIRVFFGGRTAGIQVCAIVACNNSSLKSCTVPIDLKKPSIAFKFIRIQGKFNNTNSLYMPNTLQNSILPLNVDTYEMKKSYLNENLTHVQIQTKKEINNIKTFGIYTREYGLDGQAFTQSS